ncbi:MAG: HIT family protein [Leptonema sp. (in: Bacteria)]|nr:HIT family protein [Leptonema sp. (in: bacteria)]
MASIFTKIINRELPAYIVAEDNHHLAFLDVKPVKRGHLLVIPKTEIDYIFNMSDEAYTKLNLFAKKVAQAMSQAISCKRIGTAVVGLEVPHVHIHLIPLDNLSDLDFTKERLNLAPKEFESIRDQIISKL